MIRKENQKIDSLLNRFYQEEADNMEMPDKERCWQDFQQLLEKGEQERAGVSIPAVRPEKKDSFYQFVRRYRNLTAVAAACLLVVMLLGGMPPVQTLRQVLTGSLPQADSAKLMGLKETAEEEQLLLQQNGLPEGPAAQDAAPEAADDAESFGIMQQDGMEFALLPDKEALRVAEMEELLPQDMAPAEGVRELTFDTLEQYSSSLHEYRELAPGKLFYLAAPPEGYRFREGIIAITETSLFALQQEFISPEGVRLIVQQIFPVVTTMIDEPAEKKAADYSEPDYYFFKQNGSNIMQLKREDSMITVNAALDEDSLLSISDHLVALD